MKLLIEVAGITSTWSADTNETVYFAHFLFGGQELKVEVDNQMVKAIVQEIGEQGPLTTALVRSQQPTRYEPEDDGPPEEPEENEPRTFGGDFGVQPVAAPQIFQDVIDTDSMPDESASRELTPTMQRKAEIDARMAQTPAGQRKARKLELRARAKAVPQRKVPADERGNPLVSPKRVIDKPTVVVRPVASDLGGTDDIFEQG